MTRRPNQAAVAAVAAEHLGPILYALEVCAVSMEETGRMEDAAYYRRVAGLLADAGGRAEDA
ncbi:MAG: hypothetical protein OEY20_09675 [Gemmatimonadota bacterium]|nr:hypothetical protein [Gemmatimonadota bacterium]MDH5197508.1 hypothetical protein [Gemmatimonadota bacterium]